MSEELIAHEAAPANGSTKFIMRLDVPASAAGNPRDGDYFLRSFDPDANEGQGQIELTGAINRAIKFDSPVACYNLWRTTTLLQYNAEVMTEDARAVICRRCIEYVATAGKKELYEYDPPEGYKESGTRLYIDVERAYQIIKLSPRLPRWEDKRENLLPHVLSHDIYEPHLPHVSTSRVNPGLLVRFHFTRLDDGQVEELHVFADGNHRLASDLAAGARFYFFDLSFEESRRVTSTSLFDVVGEKMIEEILTLCQRREMTTKEFYDDALDNWLRAEANREARAADNPERPTLTAINRLAALRDAAFVAARRDPASTALHCPRTPEHSGTPCKLCGQKETQS